MKAVAITVAWMLGWAVFCVGCTGTKVSVAKDGWTVSRLSILQKTDVPEVSVNGVGSIKGYSNDGGAATMAAVIEAAFKAGLAVPK